MCSSTDKPQSSQDNQRAHTLSKWMDASRRREFERKSKSRLKKQMTVIQNNQIILVDSGNGHMKKEDILASAVQELSWRLLLLALLVSHRFAEASRFPPFPSLAGSLARWFAGSVAR